MSLIFVSLLFNGGLKQAGDNSFLSELCISTGLCLSLLYFSLVLCSLSLIILISVRAVNKCGAFSGFFLEMCLVNRPTNMLVIRE
jgi:hypothetical protein